MRAARPERPFLTAGIAGTAAHPGVHELGPTYYTMTYQGDTCLPPSDSPACLYHSSILVTYSNYRVANVSRDREKGKMTQERRKYIKKRKKREKRTKTQIKLSGIYTQNHF